MAPRRTAATQIRRIPGVVARAARTAATLVLWTLAVLLSPDAASYAAEPTPTAEPSSTPTTTETAEPSPETSPGSTDPLTAEPGDAMAMSLTETGSCSVETPCVVALTEDEATAWGELRTVVIAGTAVLVFVGITTMVGNWGRGAS